MYKIIENYFSFKDERGEIKGLINFDNWQEVNYITSHKGTVRGGHYHKKTREAIIILNGKIEASFDKEIKILNEGDVLIIEPETFHTFKMIEDSSWINLLTVRNNPDSPDIYK